jgi:hypothetical protein
MPAGDRAAAAFRLQELARDAETPAWMRSLIQALQAIVAGGRDPTLAQLPGLNYTMAAEILLARNAGKAPIAPPLSSCSAGGNGAPVRFPVHLSLRVQTAFSPSQRSV